MKLYPAIDIIDGKCVRLVQGDYSQKTTFSDSPTEVAKRWESQGGDLIHIVDLDGARSGNQDNLEVIRKIAASVSVPIEVGGGVRSLEAAERLLSAGVSRVIIGTAALKTPDLVRAAVEKYGDKIVVGIDAKDGFAAVCGWEEVSSVRAVDLAREMQSLGVKYIIYTDIATDGMLKGANTAAMKEMVNAVPKVNIIASGGVSSTDDIKALEAAGVEGAIIGKALYTGALSLSEARAALSQ